MQLGTYANLLQNQYTVNPNELSNPTKWNKSPLPKAQYPTQKTLTFNSEEYPNQNEPRTEPPNQLSPNNLPISLHCNPSLPNPYKHK